MIVCIVVYGLAPPVQNVTQGICTVAWNQIYILEPAVRAFYGI